MSVGQILSPLDAKFDDRGMLVPVEFSGLQFKPVRAFLLSGANGQPRGDHAHRKCQQILWCLRGVWRVELTNTQGVTEHIALPGNESLLYIPAGVWVRAWPSEKGDMLMVLTDRPYEPDDYLRDFREFLDLTPERKDIVMERRAGGAKRYRHVS